MQTRFPDWNDPRTEQQKNLSTLLISRLTDFNRKLNQNQKYPLTHLNKNVVTITINGVPRNDNEWTQFKFPGKVTNYIPPGLQQNQTDQFYENRLKRANIKDIVEQVDEIVERYGGKVVFAVHSFGTYISTMYIHHYPEKVVGLMEFGGIPVRIYKLLKLALLPEIFGSDNVNLQAILDLKDVIYEGYSKSFEGSSMNIMKNRYNVIGFFMLLTEYFVKNLWTWRKQFKLLKFIAFGRKDKVFEPTLLHELGVHFAYGDGVPTEEDNKKYWKLYESVTGQKVPELKSIQERFVYSLPNTGHGPHVNRKPELQNIMNLYLALVLNHVENKSNL